MATLQFKGKAAVWNHHLSVPYHTLEKDEKKSLKGEDDSENIIIEGDNLLALKALLPQYQGRVKCIYIDPPYNTGNEGWVYSDSVSSPMIKDWFGKAVGKEGEDLIRHDKWLCMMTPRLKLLRELLAEDGAIFVSIDDNEHHHLRILMDEVFGEECFISDFIWKSRQIVDSRNENKVSNDHEYVVVYGRTPKVALRGRVFDKSKYSNPDNDSRGAWMSNSILGLANPEQRPNLHYTLVDPKTKNKYDPPTDTGWRYSKDTMQQKISEGRIIFPKKMDGRPREKKYIAELLNEFTGFSSILDETAGYTLNGTRDLRVILENEFPFPKPASLVKILIQQITSSTDIVLDSFAGSGTTAQAVLDLNKEDGGNRKFILVEMEDYANKLTAERVRRVIKADKNKTGFSYFSLGPAIDAESLLEGKLPKYNEFAKYVYYLATGKNHPDEKKIREKDGFVGSIGSESIWLLYKQDMDALKSLAITLDWAQKAHEKETGRKIVYAPACYLDDETLDQYNITFVSIPYNLFEKQR